MQFTPEHIDKLRAEFAKIETVNPDQLPEFHRMFASWPPEVLQQVAKAEIKFLSALARNQVMRNEGVIR